MSTGHQVMAPAPAYFGDRLVPHCSDSLCPNYDGKRCALTGSQPQSICEPEVRTMATRLASGKFTLNITVDPEKIDALRKSIEEDRAAAALLLAALRHVRDAFDEGAEVDLHLVEAAIAKAEAR